MGGPALVRTASLSAGACGSGGHGSLNSVPDLGGFPAAERDSIVALGNSDAGPPEGEAGHHHGHDMPAGNPLTSDEQAIFDAQLALARKAIESRDTIDEASALGYVLASAPIGGIGAHYVRWSQIAQPFDPAVPSMLLFDVRADPAALVGFSYAVQSDDTPDGWAGGNDHWHRHRGLCIDENSGWVIREGMSSAVGCEGTYVAGGDVWMLHAWVVPRYENLDGFFAVFNPKLCPPSAGTPDISRCPEL
jgi:hypothetical protein